MASIWVFTASSVLWHCSCPGSQLRQSHPALAQEQFRSEQTAFDEQRQQGSCRAGAVLRHLWRPPSAGGAVETDRDDDEAGEVDERFDREVAGATIVRDA